MKLWMALLVLSNVWAANDSWLQKAPERVLLNEAVLYLPKDGYHFSKEASQKCGSGKLEGKVAKGYLQCVFEQPGPTRVSFGVCEDKGRTCRTIESELTVGEGPRTPALAGVPAPPLPVEGKKFPLKASKIDGFVEGGVEEVKAEARKQNRPVFVVVSTEWCGGCTVARELIFSAPEFKPLTEDWIRVYIDGDGDPELARQWKEKTRSDAYPSLRLFTSKLELADLFRAFRWHEFEAWLPGARAHLKDPIEYAIGRVKARWDGSRWQKAKDLLAFRSAADLRAEERWVFHAFISLTRSEQLTKQGIAKGDLDPIDILQAKQMAIWMSDDRPSGVDRELVDIQTQLVELNRGQMEWLDAVDQLCRTDASSCKTEDADFEEVMTVAKTLGTRKVDHVLGVARAHNTYSRILEIQKRMDLARKHARLAAENYASSRAMAPYLAFSTVVWNNEISAMRLAGQKAEASRRNQELLDHYPDDESGYLMAIHFLSQDKAYAQALAVAERMMNRPSLAMQGRVQRAMLLLSIGKKSQARREVASALRDLKIPAGNPSAKEHNVAMMLRDLERQF